ncbi:MAG: 3-hydroxyacyl-ACP dehydratase [Shewanella sp.]|nr:3-hydroxyacyl-ACP dehydratase [Shewanella sp.]MCF1438364.1 3-hydroxyacyl-ACP dehydratase [Shewanella sp.]MCF1458677.1 3-hydroxyacyl-ACP dehydratase [Shewanella sp.]
MARVLPTPLTTEVTGHSARVELAPDATLTDFQGHFEQFSLLPGVTQIDWAIRFACQLLATPQKFCGMEVIKFQKPIKPGMQVTLELNWLADKNKLTFSYNSAKGMHSSGRIKLEPNA